MPSRITPTAALFLVALAAPRTSIPTRFGSTQPTTRPRNPSMVSSTTNHYPYEESAPTDSSALLPVSEDDESGKKKPPPLSKTALAIFALAVFALALLSLAPQGPPR